jgi:hypothetical protein
VATTRRLAYPRSITIRNEDRAINLIIQAGFALCAASSVLFHVRLFQLNAHLREHYPRMWRLFGTGNESMSRAAQYRCITKLSTEFEVSDEALNQKFLLLRHLHRSSAVGALVVVAGLLYEFVR